MITTALETFATLDTALVESLYKFIKILACAIRWSITITAVCFFLVTIIGTIINIAEWATEKLKRKGK